MAHYYDINGNLIDAVKGKNGNIRKSNIKDAREHGLLPSVTELLKIFDKPAVVNWKVDSAIEYASQNPQDASESTEMYKSRVKANCFEKSSVF